MPAGLRSFPSETIIFAEQMKQVRFLQAKCSIRLPLLIDQKRKLDSCLLAEGTGIVGIAQSDSSKCCSLVFELLLVLAQLRNVLTAEDSTIVAKKNHDCPMVSPQGTQLYRIAINIRQSHSCKLAAEGIVHQQTFYPTANDPGRSPQGSGIVCGDPGKVGANVHPDALPGGLNPLAGWVQPIWKFVLHITLTSGS